MLVAVEEQQRHQELIPADLAVVEMDAVPEAAEDKLELTVSVAEAEQDKEHQVVMVVLE
jgi:hypothetical protein